MTKKRNTIKQLINELCSKEVAFKKLDEIAIVDKGKQLNKELLFESGKFPVLNGGINPSGYWDEYNFDKNKIAISQGGASAGFVNFVPTKFWAGAHCYVVLPNEDIVINRYLYFYLKSKQETIQNSKLGAGIPGLNKKAIEQLLIPIPPLIIQDEIVKILDDFTQLEAELEAELEARKKQYEYYRDELLTFDDGVERKPLGKVAKFLRGTAITAKDTTEGDIPVVANAPKSIYFHGESNRSGETIVVARSGAYCGLVSFWEQPIFLTDAFSVYLETSSLKAKFIYYFLKKQQKAIHLMKKGYGVPHVQVKDFESYSVPVPSLAEQERIVAILDKFDALVNDISTGLPAELNARRKQYEYYREKLLTFREKEYANQS